MNAYVVTENRLVADLLRRVLPALEDEGIHVVDDAERSSAISLARTLLMSRGKPVLLVLDSGTVDADHLSEQRVTVGEMLHAAAVRSPAEVVLAEPALEAVLFESPEHLERTLQVPMTEREKVEGLYRPREVLQKLLERSARVRDPAALVASIDEPFAAELAGHPLFRRIRDFLDAATGPEGLPSGFVALAHATNGDRRH